MIVGVLKERETLEKRVACVPETVSKYIERGYEVTVEKEAGIGACFPDKAYQREGAKTASRADIFLKADILIGIKGIDVDEYNLLHAGQIVIADFKNSLDPTKTAHLKALRVRIVALEKMPRISRIQGMDVLSSQNNLNGYKAALEAMNRLDRVVPMMMTPAGTLLPVHALVLGAGIAGLQAIATLKRMGAVVYASDVRAAAREQIESVGGIFVETGETEDFESSDGYAKDISSEASKRQKKALESLLKKTDLLLTTALTGGARPPLLVTEKMLKLMPPCAVIFDLAVGNVADCPSRPDLIIIRNNRVASDVAQSASFLFSRNIFNFISAYGDALQRNDVTDDVLSAVVVADNKGGTDFQAEKTK